MALLSQRGPFARPSVDEVWDAAHLENRLFNAADPLGWRRSGRGWLARMIVRLQQAAAGGESGASDAVQFLHSVYRVGFRA